MELTDFIFPGFLLTVSLFIWRLFQSRRGNGQKKLLPRPPGSSFLTTISIITDSRHFVFIAPVLRKKYGRIFRVQIGERTMILVTDPKLMHEALIQKGSEFAFRPSDSAVQSLFSVDKCAIVFSNYGPLWRTLRRNFVTEVTTAARVKQCSWIRNWALENHMKKIKEDSLERGFVEPISICRVTACRIVICLCLGAKIPEELMKKIDGILKEIMVITTPGIPDFFPILVPLFRKHMKRAFDLRRRQLECMVPLIRERKAFVERGEIPSSGSEMVSQVGAAYVDSLFKLEPPTRGALSEEEYVTLVSEIISAGTETTATVVEWALFHMVLDQEIQEKLYKEIVEYIGKDGDVKEEDLEQMPYLNAVVKETLRRHPPSHFLIAHAVTKETELGGYRILPKDHVTFYTKWMTEDPDLWSDPANFRPERFLDGDGVAVDLTGTREEMKMLPFGTGRRICPGLNLGLLHVSLMIVKMVQAYKWLPDPNSPLEKEPEETFAFTNVMKISLRAVVLPR